MTKTLIILALMSALTVTSAQAQRLKKVYDDNINPLTQIDEAVAQAQASDRFVLCQVGGNWCPWCLRFADFVTNDTTISRVISDNYVYVHVSYNPHLRTTEEHAEWGELTMRRLGNPARFGFPVLVVLDGEGKVLHTQDSSFLEEGKSYSREKVLRFFNNWTPKAVNGTE